MSETRVLEQKVLLLAPSFCCWRGRYQMPKSKTAVELDGQTMDANNITVPQIKLLTDKWPHDANGMLWQRRFQTIESDYHRILDAYSLPFPIRGVRIIPKAAGQRFMHEVFGELVGDVPQFEPEREKQSPFYALCEAREEFVRDYGEIVSTIRQRLDPALWEHVAKKIPKAHQIGNKFTIDVVPVEMQGSESQQLDQGDLQEYQSVVSRAVQQKVNEAIETMISGPREELASAIEELHGLVAREGRVTERSFEPMRRAIAKIRLFEFTANEELLAQIRTLEGHLQNTVASQVRDVNSVREQMMEVTQTVLNEARSEASRQQAYRSLSARRHLDREPALV